MLAPMITVGSKIQLRSLFEMVMKYEPTPRKHTPKTTWITTSYLEFELEGDRLFVLKEHASLLLGGTYVVEEVGFNIADNRSWVRVNGVMFTQEFIKGY